MNKALIAENMAGESEYPLAQNGEGNYEQAEVKEIEEKRQLLFHDVLLTSLNPLKTITSNTMDWNGSGPI